MLENQWKLDRWFIVTKPISLPAATTWPLKISTGFKSSIAFIQMRAQLCESVARNARYWNQI
jgi:hypothetical protein